MNCPAGCGTALVMSERSGIEIDYCPTCRGVWLDRGELDKIIERSAAPIPQYAPNDRGGQPESYRGHRSDDDDDDDNGWHRDGNTQRSKKKKRKGEFLSDLFDFGG